MDVIDISSSSSDEKTTLKKNKKIAKDKLIIIDDEEPTILESIQCRSNDEIETELIKILKTIDWQKFHNLCMSLGNELNDMQWRFLKAIFLEKSVEFFSDDQLTYVGNEKQGCDFIVPSLNNLKIEMKYANEVLFNRKLLLKKNTKQITLLNSKGTNVHSNLPINYSDYLLIVEMNGAAIISKEKLKEYITVNGDSLSAIIPTNELEIIFAPYDINISSENINLHIKEKIMHLINEVIRNT